MNNSIKQKWVSAIYNIYAMHIDEILNSYLANYFQNLGEWDKGILTDVLKVIFQNHYLNTMSESYSEIFDIDDDVDWNEFNEDCYSEGLRSDDVIREAEYAFKENFNISDSISKAVKRIK